MDNGLKQPTYQQPAWESDSQYFNTKWPRQNKSFYKHELNTRLV
jgi:hypothetical protein